MADRYAYAIRFEQDAVGVAVLCRDLPELNSYGDDRAHAVSEAVDAIETTLSLYIDQLRAIPEATPALEGEHVIQLSAMTLAGIARWNALLALVQAREAPAANRDEDIERELENPDNLFKCWRRLDDGTYVALGRLAFTTGLCIGVQAVTPYKRLYYYSYPTEAHAEYLRLTTGDDVTSGWIARRPETAEDKEAKSRPGYDPSVFWPKRDD